MKRTFFRTAIIGTTLALAIPLWAQHGQGGGVGKVAASVTGAAAGSVNGGVSQPAGKSGHGASGNVNPSSGNHDGGNHAANAGADVSLRVSQNAGLAAQIQPLLPAQATPSGAAAGFRNQGQFVAAVHVAHNLGIPFDQLKAKVTGSDARVRTATLAWWTMGCSVSSIRISCMRSITRLRASSSSARARLAPRQ